MNTKPFEVSNETWKLLLERFNVLFPDCTLWEIHLSYPTFSVFYKHQNGLRYIERITNGKWDWGVVERYKDECGNIESDNLATTKALFEGIEPEIFINNAQSHIYKNMDYWDCPF